MKRRLIAWSLTCTTAMLLLVEPRAFASTCLWQVVPTPTGAGLNSSLWNITTIDADHAWAVGFIGSRPVIERWNGRSWTEFPSPAVAGSLIAVDATGPTSAVAIGWHSTSGGSRPLIERWDGTVWSVVPCPTVGGEYVQLDGVSALSDADMWAVGFAFNSVVPTQPLIEHWDGKAWSIIDPPQFDLGGSLYDVVALSGTDVWAVGARYPGGDSIVGLTEHWDGSSWTVVPDASPQGSQFSTVVRGVTALPSGRVIAVGTTDYAGFFKYPFAEHWDGTRWRDAHAPRDPAYTYNSFLGDVVGFADESVIGVGENTDGFIFAGKYDGTRWRFAEDPSQSGGASFLFGTDGASPSVVWAVGQFSAASGGSTTLAERLTCS